MDIGKVLVVGAGVMGSGIAQAFAQAGYEVILIDRDDELTREGLKKIKKGLENAVRKGVLKDEEKEKAIERITPTTDWNRASEADFVVEAVFEDTEVKKEVFKKLDELCRPEVIFTTNTSSLPITPIAAATKRPVRVMGMHFFNPVPAMKLVELIKGLLTDDETRRVVRELTEKLGKTPVEVNDSPGFAMTRILCTMLNEAIFCLYEGVGSPEAIDQVMKLGGGHPMGPLELADLIGLDILLHIMDTLYREFCDPKYRACPLLRKMVAAGYLGKKTKRGFYEYK
ncbi:MAG: 3-hydroxybutyryl-CoA dehydrogenase [Actinomycetota bacterium]|nr:3-hydroxybutyryl-CoA dehydrogenase [Actinomycetota bacterium]